MKKKNPSKAGAGGDDRHSGNNSAAAQRALLLDELRKGPVSTLRARRDLDILMPGTRIWELRHRYGKNIDKVMVKEPTNHGRLHTVALYVLKSEVAQ